MRRRFNDAASKEGATQLHAPMRTDRFGVCSGLLGYRMTNRGAIIVEKMHGTMGPEW